jgi:hypothetical protein
MIEIMQFKVFLINLGSGFDPLEISINNLKVERTKLITDIKTLIEGSVLKDNAKYTAIKDKTDDEFINGLNELKMDNINELGKLVKIIDDHKKTVTINNNTANDNNIVQQENKKKIELETQIKEKEKMINLMNLFNSLAKTNEALKIKMKELEERNKNIQQNTSTKVEANTEKEDTNTSTKITRLK